MEKIIPRSKSWLQPSVKLPCKLLEITTEAATLGPGISPLLCTEKTIKYEECCHSVVVCENPQLIQWHGYGIKL